MWNFRSNRFDPSSRLSPFKNKLQKIALFFLDFSRGRGEGGSEGTGSENMTSEQNTLKILFLKARKSVTTPDVVALQLSSSLIFSEIQRISNRQD